MGHPAAALSLTPGGLLGFQVGRETRGSALAARASALTVGFGRQLPRSEKGQRVPNWLRLATRRAGVLSPQVQSLPCHLRGRQWGEASLVQHGSQANPTSRGFSAAAGKSETLRRLRVSERSRSRTTTSSAAPYLPGFLSTIDIRGAEGKYCSKHLKIKNIKGRKNS